MQESHLPIMRTSSRSKFQHLTMAPLYMESSFVSSEGQSSWSTLTSQQDACEKCEPLHEQIETKRPLRKVSFSDNRIVVATIHRNDMTEAEKDSSWLSYEEIRAIKMDCVGLVGMLEDGMAEMILLEDEDDLCLRGLEQYSGEGHQRRLAAQKQIYKDVLEIQSFANFQGASQPELIAEASRRGSELLIQEAVEIGRYDALCAALLE